MFEYDGDITALVEETNYHYSFEEIKFQISQTCTEGNFWDDVLDLGPQIYKFLIHDEDLGSFEEECNGKSFEKLKYSKSSVKEKYLYDDYAEGVIEGKILYEFNL
jgi:hypothetical protein